jgi:uncharacterized protein YjlB
MYVGDVVVVLAGAGAAELGDGADVVVVGVLDGGAATDDGSTAFQLCDVCSAMKPNVAIAITPATPVINFVVRCSNQRASSRWVEKSCRSSAMHGW